MKSSVTKPAAAVEQCQVKSRKSFFSSQNWNVNVNGNNFDLGRDVINDIASH